VAIAGLGSSPLAIPGTSLAAGAQSQWLGENTLRLLPPLGCWVLGVGGWGLCARNFALGAVVAASVPPPAGGDQLPTSVRPFCPLSPVPPQVRDAPARAVPFSHTPQPVRQASTVALTLLP